MTSNNFLVNLLNYINFMCWTFCTKILLLWISVYLSVISMAICMHLCSRISHKYNLINKICSDVFYIVHMYDVQQMVILSIKWVNTGPDSFCSILFSFTVILTKIIYSRIIFTIWANKDRKFSNKDIIAFHSWLHVCFDVFLWFEVWCQQSYSNMSHICFLDL